MKTIKDLVFRPFTDQSLVDMKVRIRTKEKEHLTRLAQKECLAREKTRVTKKRPVKPRPNPSLAEGRSLPLDDLDFPGEYYGTPLEELDDFYKDKHTYFLEYIFSRSASSNVGERSHL